MRAARFHLWLAAVIFCVAGCDLVAQVLPREGAIPDAPFAGDRRDAPPLEKRGNAAFASLAFDDTGKLLLTAGIGVIQVWDAQTGTHSANVDTGLPQPSNDQWMIDSTRERVLAIRRPGGIHALFELRLRRPRGQSVKDLRELDRLAMS